MALVFVLSFSARADSSPLIDVWYGSTQDVGHIGIPQVWVNILGNVSDPDGITSLSYSLNGGSPYTLSLGSDGRRLESPGDFNVDIAYADLTDGANHVVITATDTLSNTAVETIAVNYSDGNTWPLPYSVDWSSVTNIQDVAQVVDGLWGLESDSVRTLEPGYDRLIAIGDVAWTDYEVTVPITMHTIGGNGGAGILIRWNGHTDSPVSGWQPKSGWYPLGAIGWYRKDYLELYGNGGHVIARDATRTLTTGIPYMFKMRVETIPGQGGLYSLKVWESGQPEPSEWDLTGQEALTDPQAGSMMLLAHQLDTSFGDVTVAPLGEAANTLTVNTVGSGMVAVDPDQSEYGYGQVVTLTAQPDSGWSFTGWSGDLSGSDNPDTLTMSGDRVVTTTFTEKMSHTITINTVGSGMVQVEPDQPGYTHGQVVTLTAQPDPGWAFGGWSGDLVSRTNPATLTVTDEKAVTATFADAPVSDDFNACSLNTELWTWIDPVGDGTNSLVGTFTEDAWLSISVPAGTDHDIWDEGNRAPRIMQPISDKDFELEVKFESALTGKYQMQGMLVEQDSDDFLRFEFYSLEPHTILYAAIFEAGPPVTPTFEYKQAITGTGVAPLYMRVGRHGDEWSQSYSYDGVEWTTSLTFTHAMTATSVGTYAGNAQDQKSPAHTAYIDYFFNTAAPISPEDGDRNTLTINADPMGRGTVSIDPNKTAYACGEAVELSAEADTGWTFDRWSGDLVTTTNPISVTMTGSRVITAHFTNLGNAPVIKVIKEGPASADIGETVVYTFTVTNDDTAGDGSIIDSVTVEDDVAGPATYVAGDLGNDGLLEVGETWIYATSYTVQPGDPDLLVNTATASGLDLEGATVSDTDTHELVLDYRPAIQVEKDGPTSATIGDPVVYTFTVTNDGTAGDGSVIDSVTVEDDVVGPATYVAGDLGNDGLLEVGETWVYTASYTIQPDDPDPLVNTVTASGLDLDDDPVPDDTDTHSLDIAHAPAIKVVIDGPISANVGDNVVYTFAVTNDDAAGDGSAITSVTVEDDVAGPATYVAGDDGDDILEVGETWVYVASYTIQPDDPDPLVNTATASGLDLDGTAVSDTDTHSVFLEEQFIFLPLVFADI